MIRGMTEGEYIFAWSLNGQQHFDDGDYEWICNKIRQIPSENPLNHILEIGCGAGYSTLAFVLRGFEVFAIDMKEKAIESTRKLLEKNNCSPSRNIIRLYRADIVHDFKQIKEAVEKTHIDLIVLCNPGGNTEKNLSVQEKKWLNFGNFTEDEYTIENLPQLHTYAMINASCGLANYLGIPILIIQRDNKNEIANTLSRIGLDAHIRLINTCFRQIKPPPDGGVPLSECASGQLYWGMGLYFP